MNTQITVPYEKVTITPTMAAAWYTNQATNRKLQIPHAQIIASDIENGNWFSENFYNPIKFNKAGQLIDGQHRCRAIMIADKSVTTYIQRNVSKEEAARIDDTRERNFVDKEALKGLALQKEVVAAAFMAKFGVLFSKTAGTTEVITAAHKDFGKGAEFAYATLGTGGFNIPIMAAVAKAIHTSALDQKKVIEFIDGLLVNNSKIKQAADLRNLLLTRKEVTKAVNNRVKLFLITFRAIVDHCQGRNRPLLETEFNLRPAQLKV